MPKAKETYSVNVFSTKKIIIIQCNNNKGHLSCFETVRSFRYRKSKILRNPLQDNAQKNSINQSKKQACLDEGELFCILSDLQA